MTAVTYFTPITTQEELRNRIVEAAAIIKDRPDVIRSAKDTCIRRAECCIPENGDNLNLDSKRCIVT